MINELYNDLPTWLNPPDYSRYLSDNYVVVDFETTNLDKGSPYDRDNRIVSGQWKCGPDHEEFTGTTEYIRGNEYELGRLVEAIEQADFWVAHNSKFEYGWLERCGLPLEKSLAWCTQLGEYVIRSNRPGLLNLDACLARRGYKSKDRLGKLLLKCGICPSIWPESWLEKYAKPDVYLTERLFLDQREAIVRTNKLGCIFTRNIFTPVLVDIEKNGLCLDKERVEILYRDYHHKMQDLESQLVELIGGANLNSPKQMRQVLYEDFKFKEPTAAKWLGKNGDPTTKSDYILTLKPKNKKQAKLQSLQKEASNVGAALSKALNKFMDCVTERDDNILFAALIQTRTATQRLASLGKEYKAQMQNIHRIFKPLFKAREEDWLVGEFDQAQLEYRVAVFLGQDEAGMKSIVEKIDRHAITATKIFGDEFVNPSSKERRDELRTDAKADTFKPLYGGQSGTPGQVAYYEAFKAEHTGIVTAQTKWKHDALNTGRVRIPTGLTFYFPNTKMTKTGYITNSTNICNYPVQSLATADIVPVMVTYMWYFMRAAKLQSFLVNTVHDSAIAEIHPDETKVMEDIASHSGTDVVIKYLKHVYNIDFNVPLEVESKFASHWNDSEYWRKKYLK